MALIRELHVYGSVEKVNEKEVVKEYNIWDLKKIIEKAEETHGKWI